MEWQDGGRSVPDHPQDHAVGRSREPEHAAILGRRRVYSQCQWLSDWAKGSGTRYGPFERDSHREQAMRASTLLALSAALLAGLPLPAQHGAKNGEWRFYGGDAGTTK